MQRLIAAALVALLLAACSMVPSDGTLTGEWSLGSGALRGAAITPVADAPITLTLDATEASGSAGCNSYSGSVTLAGERVTFGDMLTTLMGCQPAQADAESAYLEALHLVERGRRDGDRLTLSGPQAELAFDLVPPTPDATLVGTDWRLETVIQGDAALSFDGVEGIRAAFADGSVTVTVGCRVLAGSYTTTGGEVAVDRMDVGANSCPDAVLAAVERTIVDGLADGFTASISEDRLQLTTDSGMGLEFRAATR